MHRNAERAAARVAVVGIPAEQRVLVVDTIVDSSAEQIAHIGSGGQRAETRHRGQVRLHDIHAVLIRALVAAEEMDHVLLDRTADHESSLLTREFRIVRQRTASEARIGRDVFVAEVVVPGAANQIGARSGNDVDRPECRDAR